MNWANSWVGSSGLKQRRHSTSIGVGRKALKSELESAAKRDGEAGLPGQYDEALSQYEQQLVLEGQQFMQNIVEDMQEQDARIYPRFIQARRDHRDASEQYVSKKTELGGRPVNIQMSSMVYWPLMLLMSLCEVFVNFKAFETVFSAEASITSLMASAVLAIVLVFAAHSIGGAVQQHKNKVWAIVLGLLTIGITFSLAYIRLVYIGHENSTGIGLFEKPKLNADMITGFFVLFNLLFLVLAAWLAAKLHDNDETYEQRFKNYLKAREALVKAKQIRDGNQRHHLREARDSLGLYRKLISNYRDLNMQSREIKATPQVWVNNSPQTLLTLDDKAFDLDDNVSGFEEETKQL